MNSKTRFLAIDGNEIEYILYAAAPSMEEFPTLVFLHEGLGSTELWRDVPQLVAKKLGNPRILIYSRLGYGKSTPRSCNWSVDYMHEEALMFLPKVLEKLSIDNPVLIGHSDGASIALIYAGELKKVSALVLIAPHVFVEQRSLDSISEAKNAFTTTDLAQRLAKYHKDSAATFWGWNNAWLSTEFGDWNIEKFLPSIGSPVLVIQGDLDEYGTYAQIESITQNVSGRVDVKIIERSRHSPHLEDKENVTSLIAEFLYENLVEAKGVESADY